MNRRRFEIPGKLAEVVVDGRSFKVDGVELAHLMTGYSCHYEAGQAPEITLVLLTDALVEKLGLNPETVVSDTVMVTVRGAVNRAREEDS